MRSLSWKVALAIGIAVYAVMAIAGGIRNREQMNPDGLSYIMLAKHLAAGEAGASVSAHWSPMITWCITPLVWAGVDGLYAARVVMGLWGLALVIAAWVFMRRFVEMPPTWGAAAMAAIGMEAALLSVKMITPDTMVATLLLLYLALALDKRLLSDWRVGLGCGLIAGGAYLAKAYAWPFFVAHYPVAIGLSYLREKWEGRKREGLGWGAAKAWGAGMAGLVAVSGAWMAVVWAESGRVQIAEPTNISAGTMLPDGTTIPKAAKLLKSRLWRAQPPRLSIWETPERMLEEEKGTPGRGVGAIIAEKKQLAKINAGKLMWVIMRFDAARLGIIFTCATAALIAIMWGNTWFRFRGIWFLATAAIFTGGYVLVWVEDRLISPMMWPMVCAWCMQVGWIGWQKAREREEAWRDSRWIGGVTAGIIAASFALTALASWSDYMGMPERGTERARAEKLAAMGCAGPMACTDWGTGWFVAYHMGANYAGTMASKEPEKCMQELDRFGVKTFLAQEKSGLAEAMDGKDGWVLRKDFTDVAGGRMGKMRVLTR